MVIFFPLASIYGYASNNVQYNNTSDVCILMIFSVNNNSKVYNLIQSHFKKVISAPLISISAEKKNIASSPHI